jgi:hypothetical protein
MSIVSSHLRDGTAVVTESFINSTQTFRSVESRSTINEQDSSMAKFAIGDVVVKDKGRRRESSGDLHDPRG